MTKKLSYDDYTVGWLAVLEVELDAVRLLLDNEHASLPPKGKDDNIYILGEMGAHNVVIACPAGYGTNAASHTVTNMLRTYENIRFGLLVGVGGGAPTPNNPRKDIRLGDVVVSRPEGSNGGVFQFDMGKQVDEEYKIQSHLNKPPGLLIQATKVVSSNQKLKRGEMNDYIQKAIKAAEELTDLDQPNFPGRDKDKLFKASFKHKPSAPGEDNYNCENCDDTMQEIRKDRMTTAPAVHYGTIASSNTVMRSAQRRDELRDKWGVSCFEMEAAGLMDSFPCMVIRGICDYSDGHKSKTWQPYAALTAAGYAKDLLRVIQVEEVKKVPRAVETTIPNADTNSRTPTASAVITPPTASAAITPPTASAAITPPATPKGKQRVTDNSQDVDHAKSPATPPRPQIPTTSSSTSLPGRHDKSIPEWLPPGLEFMSRDQMKGQKKRRQDVPGSGMAKAMFTYPDGSDIVLVGERDAFYLTYKHVAYQLWWCPVRAPEQHRKAVPAQWKVTDKKIETLPAKLKEDVLYLYISHPGSDENRYILPELIE
ncbi:hypothetical protein TWF506_006613 [Arthrobotrys conoides]|uniref:Nucleoside phosphorylase domain-containing protein n=1 Tax=Arthrobotrys conoides TaxID=74498 RepID=A0AAN8S1A5_9PEZI